MKALLPALLLLSGCMGSQTPLEPQVRTVEVQVPVPVPCSTLQALSTEPTYPDTDEALRAAPNIFVRTQLLVQGRLLRIARLAQYTAAKASCL